MACATGALNLHRSEERRVGKEGRFRGAPYYLKKKKKKKRTTIHTRRSGDVGHHSCRRGVATSTLNMSIGDWTMFSSDVLSFFFFFFFSSRRRHTRLVSDWSSDVCSSDLFTTGAAPTAPASPSPADG